MSTEPLPMASADGDTRQDGGSGRLNIAVLLDYANIIAGGYESHLREALDAKCRRDGHTLVIVYGGCLDAPHPLGRADNVIFSVLRPESFDGFIVASSSLAAFSGPAAVARLLEDLRPASVCSLGIALPGVPSLLLDNRTGLEAVVEHLIHYHGCRRPVFLAGPPHNPDSEERLQAYQDVLRRNGLPLDPDLVVCATFRNDHARSAIDDLVRRGVSFDSVVAANDPMAVGAIETLRKWGRRVPRDIPVTGFDDLQLARLGDPPLTTVAQPFEQMADLAVESIVAQRARRPVPARVVLPTRLVCRQSCGCKDEAQSLVTPCSLAKGKAGEGVVMRVEGLRPRLRSMLRGRPGDSALISTRLIDALLAVGAGHPQAFRRAVGDLLEDIADQNDRHQILQEAITWLRDELADLAELDLERAFYEGLSLVAHSGTSTQLQQQLSADDSYFRLLSFGGQASLAFDLSSLKQALCNTMPAAGVRTIFLSCAASSTSTDLVPLLALVDGAVVEPAETSFPASRLLPRLALQLERRRTLLVFPMALGSQLLGVAAVDYLDGVKPFAAFRVEITLLLRGIHLRQDLVQETLLRERSVQERLAATKRMEALSVLAGGVAHDLNNALGPLVALPDVILDELDRLPVPVETIADMRGDVESIRSASLRAAQTIKDLLTLGRQGRTIRRNLDLNGVVKSCLADNSLRAASGGHARVNMVVDLHAEPLRMRGAESQLARAVANLVRNAVEATSGDGRVTVRTSRVEVSVAAGGYETIPPGHYALLSVSDDGCGIGEDYVSHMFEPFFTTKPTGERSGSGLGLAIVHGVVKEHEGFIDVTSAPDKGTSFLLYFPLERVRAASCEQIAAAPHGHARILIVDDEVMQLRTCRRLLVRLGYEVEVMQSGLAARDLFAKAAPSGKSPFDLVIMDMVLGEALDGLQILELIQRAFPAQKAVIVSGHAPNERAEQAMKKGLPWLTKPYAIEQLARIVAQTLEDRDPRQ